jgi:hypothetical protein
MNNIKQVNNADLAIKKLRILQEMYFRHDVTDNDLFNYTNEIIKQVEMAAKDINTNFEDVSKKLTDFMNGKR